MKQNIVFTERAIELMDTIDITIRDLLNRESEEIARWSQVTTVTPGHVLSALTRVIELLEALRPAEPDAAGAAHRHRDDVETEPDDQKSGHPIRWKEKGDEIEHHAEQVPV